jgi:predicted permease
MSVPDGAVLALTIGFPNAAAVALPLLANAYGAEAAVPAALSIAVGSITVTPVTIALLELTGNPANPAITPSALIRSMLHSFAKPVVWSPIVALICVCAEIHFPSYIQGTLETLGNASTGSALLLTGLVISAQPFHLDASVVLSTIAKLVGQPLLALSICLSLGLPAAELRAVTLINAIPGGFFGLVFGKSFNAKAQAASSSLIANYAVSVLSLPLWILILNRWM